MESYEPPAAPGEDAAQHHPSRLVEPDVMLPSQYFEPAAGRRLLEGEKRLMLAVLEDAVACFQQHADAARGRRKRLFDEAAEWIFEDHAPWTFSFLSICGTLGISPSFLREGLRRWKQDRLAAGGAAQKYSRLRLGAARRHQIRAVARRRRVRAA